MLETGLMTVRSWESSGCFLIAGRKPPLLARNPRSGDRTGNEDAVVQDKVEELQEFIDGELMLSNPLETRVRQGELGVGLRYLFGMSAREDGSPLGPIDARVRRTGIPADKAWIVGRSLLPGRRNRQPTPGTPIRG